MTKEWQIVKEIEKNWSLDRPVISKENTLQNVPGMLEREVQELQEEVLLFSSDQSPERRKMLLQECADVGIFLMALFRLLDSDMMEEISEKICLNHLRYPASQFQEGDYKEIYQRLKEKNKQDGVVKQFYEF